MAGSLSQTSKGQRKKLGVDGSLTFCGDAQKESENKAFIPVFDLIRSVKSTKTVMLRYTRVSQKSGISTLASLRYASGWVRLTDKQSTMKDSLVDRITYVMWRCTEGVRKQDVIQVFHPIQSVKSTNKVTLA